MDDTPSGAQFIRPRGSRHLVFACNQAVHDVTPEGFAAIKVTALGNPMLLERMCVCPTSIPPQYTRFLSAQTGRTKWVARAHGGTIYGWGQASKPWFNSPLGRISGQRVQLCTTMD